MSGPKTSQYSIRAARQQEQTRRQAEERKRREAMAARVAAAEDRRCDLEKRAARLEGAIEGLRERFPAERIDVTVPDCDAPQTEDPRSLEDFVVQLENDLLKAEAALRKRGEQVEANQDFRRATRSSAELWKGTVSTADEAMRRFIEAKAASASESTTTKRRVEIDRILGRQGSEHWREATPKLERLVMEALSADSENRFAALTTEMRLQVHEIGKLKEARKAYAEKASTLLDRLDLEIPSGERHLKQRLELVKVGAIPFTEDFESLAHKALAKAEEANRARLHSSAAEIVKDTLADLGYDVASIEETLFARGGKVYFRKAGWSDYCVRLTVRPQENKMNFNVVRMAEKAGDRESSLREADIEAENAWCSGYQQLVDTFAARGLGTQLTRHLPVGAVPVQVVGADELALSAFGPQERKREKGKTARSRGGDTK